MAFRNPPIAGVYLVRPAIQSPNYVLGTSGWTVNRDGTSEFNSGTFRGSIEVGPLAGAHFIVNNSATGDIVDVYNSSNKLIFKIDATGRVFSYSTSSTAFAEFVAGVLSFGDTTVTPQLPLDIQGSLTSATTLVSLSSGLPPTAVGAATEAFIQATANAGAASEYILVGQRGVQGMMVQTDNGVNSGQLIHIANYSGTTDANGHLVFNHNCNFTPSGAFIMGRAPAVGTFPNLTYGTDGFTSTLANFSFIIANTNVVYANASVMFQALFYA